VLHRLLLALPTLGMISGVLLSMVLGLLGAGSVEGRPLSLVAAAIYGGMLLLAGRTVTRCSSGQEARLTCPASSAVGRTLTRPA
jgi:hypothetical protein